MDRIDRMVLQFREVLTETEKLPAAELRAYQDKLLIPLLRHAREQSPFYRERLDAVLRGDEVDPTMGQARRSSPARKRIATPTALKALALPRHAGPASSEETSGSTGRPFEHLRNELQAVANTAMTDRTFRWWGLDGDKTMASFISRKQTFRRRRKARRDWLARWLSRLAPRIDMWADTDAQIGWLARAQADYLTAYSSTLLALAERVRQKGVDLRFERSFPTPPRSPTRSATSAKRF